MGAEYQILIDGKWGDSVSGEYFETSNPYSGEPWAMIPRCGEADVARAVEAASTAFESGPWPGLTATKRGALLRKLGDLVAEQAEPLARTEVRDNGKLIAEMLGQTRYVPQWFHYYAGLADKIEGGVIPIDKAGVFNFTRWEPLGVVVAIVPWNSPLLILTWKLAPALAAGNTVVVKPSEYTSAATLEFGRLIEQAGFPPGVVNILTGFGGEVGEPLVAHPKVAKVAFTGGEMSGQRVYQSAARGLKRVTLELGGKSPNVVFDDAIIEDAVKGAISGIFAASGQTCIAGSRLLVQRSIHKEFVDRLVAFASTAKMGDPAKLDTQVGPVTTPPQYEKILDYIAIGKTEGARVALAAARRTRAASEAGSSSRRSSRKSTTRCASPRKKSLARCCRSFHSTMRKRRSLSPTIRSTGLQRAYGRKVFAARS